MVRIGVAVCAVTVLVAAAIVDVDEVHARTGRYAFAPWTSSEVVVVDDRRYRLSDVHEGIGVGEQPIAALPAHATAYAVPGNPDAPTIIHVRRDQNVTTYSLVGGP